MQSLAPQLSRMRTLLFGVFAFVWFSEMVLWGFQPLAEVWTTVSNMIPPENLQLATALYITHAVRAAAKGALGVLAVYGLRSKHPAARTALFVSMALVPPLNLAFLFRAQDFPLRLTAVAIVFTIIPWGSFFLFRESTRQPEQGGKSGSGQRPPARWEIFQYLWFAVNAAGLTLIAILLLFGPRTALNFTFPCLSSLPTTYNEGLASLIFSNISNGTHLLALATATWIAAVYCRRYLPLRQAVTLASTLHAGLLCLLPLRQIILEVGGNCATSSILVLSVPLLIGWVLYGIVDMTHIRHSAGSRSHLSTYSTLEEIL
jgi:hypothetical protein